MDITDSLMALRTDHSDMDRSLSPMYSNFGLCFGEEQACIRQLVLHYNRKTRVLFEPFITFLKRGSSLSTFSSSRFFSEIADFELCFYKTDAFLVSGSSPFSVSLLEKKSDGMEDLWVEYGDEKTVVFRGYSKNGDDRDPDGHVPVMIGISVARGTLYCESGVVISPDEEGKIEFRVALSLFDCDVPGTLEALSCAPGGVSKAKSLMRAWARECAGDIKNLPSDKDAEKTFLTAVSGLLMNLTKAPGALDGFVSSFPSRGGYPTHFMWDSAFQNLAYEVMSESIALDSIMQLARNIRPDGKIPQFLCSTWARPHHAQPALLGWAAKRYAERVGKYFLPKDFSREMYGVLSKNNRWWLNNRITSSGLIYCPDGLETGQDDSPRFDKGEVLAVDMNSYLLSQMRAAAYFARLLNDKDGEAYWNDKARELSSLIIAYLYDEEKNLFFDADKNTGEKQTLISLSAFMPLWAGVELPEKRIRSMIESYLLNEKYFFSDVPFPSVAYSEDCYEHGHWWRGPTWMPVAWLMLETLEKYGYESERRQASRRLYDIMLRDGVLHELFDSKTGEGLGETEQGWTAAIFIRLAAENGG